MESFEGFKVVKMRYDKLSEETCQLFFKPHSVREYNAKKPGGRTLFIINIPPYINKESIQSIMKKFGRVENVFMHKKPNSKAPPDIKFPILDPEEQPQGYKVSYVVFKNSKSVQEAMSLPSEEVLVASNDTSPILTGLSKWHQEYNAAFRAEDALRGEVKRVMADYDARKASEKEQQSNEPDDEGWVTVTSSRKRKRAAEGEEQKQQPSKRRRKKKILHHFYAFQQKEVNMKHLEEKRKKFEEDGRRMALLRSSRKFKPH